MIMTVPILIPSPAASHASMASDTPRTPVSPNSTNLPLPDVQTQQQQLGVASSDPSGQTKRKPSRRANTAERRATHNAVERQRRETLNGRFLDLAALLPNLSQIRRPSKSSIVNSSIAHIHASRRHRLLASRELRTIKNETDALRRELNEWRGRAGLPRIEEPVRGEGFSMILGAELEVIASVPGDDDDEEQYGGYGYTGYNEAEDEFAHGMDGGARHPMAMIKNANANPFAHNLPPAHSRHASHSGPMVTGNPAAGSYENPSMGSLYEQNQGQYQGLQFMHQHQQQQHQHQQQQQPHAMYSAISTPQHHQIMAQRSLYTPPASSHGLPSAPPSSSGNPPVNPFADQSYFLNMQRQQQLAAMQQQQQPNRIYGSPEPEENGSQDEPRRGRERSSSVSNGYSSPTQATAQGNYEVPTTPPVNVVTGEYAVPRRGSAPTWGNPDLGLIKQTSSPSFSLMI